MCIITDTAQKMNVSTEMVFEMWGCFEKGATKSDVDRLYDKWYYTGKVDRRVESFCIDILTDRIPLITLPPPKQKARKIP